MGLSVQTPERRELRGKTRGGELKDMLDFALVAQAMFAKIDKLEWHPGGGEVPQQLPSGFGQQNLTAGASCQQSAETIERGRAVVAVVRSRRPGVQRHADPNWAEIAPVFGDQGVLGGNCGQHRVEGRGKDGLDGVADDLEANAIVDADRFVKMREVPLDGGAHSRRVLLPAPGATLDVCDQEGDRPAWKVAHRDPWESLLFASAWGF